jgi:UDP-glucose 4-epimerase
MKTSKQKAKIKKQKSKVRKAARKAPPASVLVVGGAGYIGSHVVRALLQSGRQVVVLDNLSRGHLRSLRTLERAEGCAIPLIKADLGEPRGLRKLFAARHFDAVMHFAAYCYVGESTQDPAAYYRNNAGGTAVLLEEMNRAGIRRFVFSSTCAVYGNPVKVPMPEDHPFAPINPYGRSKRMVEEMLVDLDAAGQMRAVALRYFNASGCSSDGLIGEQHEPETHLIPLALAAAYGHIPRLQVYGEDYPTPDGTCVRDYIHVEDLASAHLLALDWLSAHDATMFCNVGTGSGHSVRQVMATVERVTGRAVPHVVVPRRPGDPPELVASGGRIRSELGWQPRYTSLDAIVETADRWYRKMKRLKA